MTASNRAVAPLLLLVGVLALPGCFQVESQLCSTGLACPLGTACSANGQRCIRDACGNGVVDANEACDDGDTDDGDGCSGDCRSLEVCGNGIVDEQAGEVCDRGDTVGADGCSADCRSSELCGNGIVDTAVRELCDDGNTTNGDGCSADCQSREVCGNRYTDVARGEACDDGNTDDLDGCSANCRSNETCGNGVVDLTRGEVCDDGNTSPADGCSASCRSTEVCGNGIRDEGTSEQCDDGNSDETDGCLRNCTVQDAYCGNGRVDRIQEECDDGNDSDADNCANCLFARCGDGFVDRAAPNLEACDDGNRVSGDGCSADCASTERCGDGVLDRSRGEVCDDGNAVGGDGCSANCRSDETCGNDVVDTFPDAPARSEVCDEGADNDRTRCPYGQATCDLCTAQCKTLVQGVGDVCGDGVVNSAEGETCDDGNALACGTCSADCRTAQPPQAARGRITPPSNGNRELDRYDIFELSDGVAPSRVFEFDLNDDWDRSRVRIDVKTADTRTKVAEAIKAAIDSQAGVLGITATLEAGTDRVLLENTRQGSVGNRPIVSQVIARDFAVQGMSGGFGWDCPADTGCRNEADCSSVAALVCAPATPTTPQRCAAQP